MKTKKKWKSLIHKIEYLKLDLEEKEEILKSFEQEFSIALSNYASSSDKEIKNDENSKDIVLSNSSSDTNDNEDEKNEKDVCIEDQSVQNNFKNQVEEIEIEDKNESIKKPNSMKKLWKAIVSATHPDITGGDKEKTELYKKAVKAWKNGSIDDLFDIAVELKIEVPDPDEDLLIILSERASSLEQQIKKIENSVLWLWGNADDTKKEHIIKFYIFKKARG